MVSPPVHLISLQLIHTHQVDYLLEFRPECDHNLIISVHHWTRELAVVLKQVVN